MESGSPTTNDVFEKIAEIRDYYDACEMLYGSPSRISKFMLAFALGYEEPEFIEPVLQELHRQGKLAAVLEQDVVFAPAFAGR